MSQITLRRALILVAAAASLFGCGNDERRGNAELAQAPPSSLETHKDFGEYRVHFNALSTDSLAPQVAKAYGIVRSKSRAMLNVSLMRRNQSGPDQPVTGKVVVNASNLTGQLKVIALREIVEGEGEAIYYIGELPVADGETLIFDIAVTPEGETASYQIRFQKQFFTS